MGKLIIEYKIKNRNEIESLNCKSQARAEEIVSKRNNVVSWNFYPTGKRIPPKNKAVKNTMPMSFEELEVAMRRERLI